MTNKYLSVLKQLPFFSVIKNNESLLINSLRIFGMTSCAGVGATVGFAIAGFQGMAFGGILGYVTGKLLLGTFKKF